MDSDNGKYEKIVRYLRSAEPELRNVEELADRVMDTIRDKRRAAVQPSRIFDLLFGWNRVGWVRNLLAAGVCVVITLFIVQYAGLNRKVNELEKQLIRSSYNYYGSPYTSARNLMRYALPGNIITADSIKISRQDLLELLEHYNAGEIRDPQLREMLRSDSRYRRFMNMRPKTKNQNKVNQTI